MAASKYEQGVVYGEYDGLYGKKWEGYHPKRVSDEQQELIDDLHGMLAEHDWELASTGGLYKPAYNTDKPRFLHDVSFAFQTQRPRHDYSYDINRALKPPVLRDKNTYPSRKPGTPTIILPYPLGPFPVTPKDVTRDFLIGLTPNVSESISAILLRPGEQYLWTGSKWEHNGLATNIVVFEVTFMDHAPELYKQYRESKVAEDLDAAAIERLLKEKKALQALLGEARV